MEREATKQCSDCGAPVPQYHLKHHIGQCRRCRLQRAKASAARSGTAQKRGCTHADVDRCRAGRCVICNVPPWTLARYRLGVMQVGHIVPGDARGGFEPMCRICNKYLGARVLTAKTGREVLRRARRYWSRLAMRDEAWVHTDVDERGFGYGGVSEPPGRARKLEAFDAEREQRKGTGGLTDSGAPDVPAVGTDDGVVLADTPVGGSPEV